MIVALGVALVCLGALVLLLERLNIRLGRLPGDIVLRSRGGSFYFPIVTCILLSVLASLLVRLLKSR